MSAHQRENEQNGTQQTAIIDSMKAMVRDRITIRVMSWVSESAGASDARASNN